MEISLKKNLMMKMLDQVPNLGWTWNALHEAAKTAKKTKNFNKKELQTLFDNKISNIISTFNDKLDEDMYVIFNAENNKDLGTTDTVKALILSRLKTLALLSFNINLITALPITTLLVIFWLYFEKVPSQDISDYVKNTLYFFVGNNRGTGALLCQKLCKITIKLYL